MVGENCKTSEGFCFSSSWYTLKKPETEQYRWQLWFIQDTPIKD